MAAELREHLGRASTLARLRLAGAGLGLDAAAVDLVVMRWQAMIARRESGEGPLSVRG